MQPYHLFLDDVRKPIDAYLHTRDERFVKLEWVIVRSHEAFIKEISSRFQLGQFPSLVAFDHDLADQHYQHLEGDIPYDSLQERTGYHSAQWLVDFCITHRVRLPECTCHSMNPAGRENILSLLRSYRKVEDEIANLGGRP
jgi:hypothetical protein